MYSPRYALVGYVRNPVGEFIRKLRKELHPDLPHLAAHLTILPPRPLHGTEQEARELLERICSRAEPFEVTLGDVESFIPTTPTVYIQIAHSASRMSALHDLLNTQALGFHEEWPYMPHLTIVKLPSEALALEALTVARSRWGEYSGPRRILLDRLTFVREDIQDHWVDLAPVPLGENLVSR